MFSSEMVPWPRRVLKERWSLSLRFSNMVLRVYQVCAAGRRSRFPSGMTTKGLVGHLFVEVAPAPGFAGLVGLHDRVLGRVEVFGGVEAGGGVAATDVAAGEAGAEVDPLLAGLHALLAAGCVGFVGMGGFEVFAEGHRWRIARGKGAWCRGGYADDVGSGGRSGRRGRVWGGIIGGCGKRLD